jgi:regulation of enolase protein 1 (concanavalin A-like superfamily)
MKKMIFSAFLVGLLTSTLRAQVVKINAIPYVMNFQNSVIEYKITGDNSLEINAPGHTDLFISPDGGYVINKSPRLIFTPDSDFILTAKIKPGFKSKWDAGALLIFNDATHFAKFCFESDFKGQARVVSVVCNETADDCNSMIVDKNEIFYRITGSTKGKTFGFYYSTDGKSWFPIRTFKLDKTDNLTIGFSAQSPTGEGSSVEFSNIDLQQRKADLWTGN